MPRIGISAPLRPDPFRPKDESRLDSRPAEGRPSLVADCLELLGLLHGAEEIPTLGIRIEVHSHDDPFLRGVIDAGAAGPCCCRFAIFLVVSNAA